MTVVWSPSDADEVVQPVDAAGGDDLDAVAHPRSRWVTRFIVGYVWLRIGLIVSSGVFATPDTESYRAGQGLRPPLSSALLTWIGAMPYVIVSSIISTAGFLALMVAAWDKRRLHRSTVIAGAIAIVSLTPGVVTYEHWLVPDSLLIGLATLALALAWRGDLAPGGRRAHRWMFVACCASICVTKEVGLAVVALIAVVVVMRRCWRVAAAAVVLSALLFATVVGPASNREGTVIWREPRDTALTMERFRIVVAGLIWSDISPRLADVKRLSGECGMTIEQLIIETFLLPERVVAFEDCPELWKVVDGMSQLDVLRAHLDNPAHVPAAIERGLVPNMWAMTLWSHATLDEPWLLRLDRWAAGAVVLLPVLALAVALARRRGRRLGLVAVMGTCLALAATLVDPTGQDRHSIVFRIVAGGIALISLTGLERDPAELDV